MVLVHDYPVRKKSLEQLESFADNLRAKLGISSRNTNVFRLLFEDMPDYLRELGLTMISRSAGYMGERDAYAVSKPNRIFYRPRLLAELRMGVAKARVEFVHELGHILLHPGAAKAWVTGGNDVKAYIANEESAEWQATTFAICFLAPKALAANCRTAEQLAEDFGIDIRHATERFEHVARRRTRSVPSIYNAVRRELTRDLAEPTFLGERCYCGESTLIRIDNKYRCASCGRMSDIFQDGDLVDF